MSLLNVVLWLGGVGLLALGITRIRGPIARRQALDSTSANLQRYDEWRGNRLRPEPGERTGADEMRDELSRQVRIWAVVTGAGFGLIVAGFVVR